MNRGAMQIVAGAACFGLIPLILTACSSDSVFLIAAGRAAFAALFTGVILLIRKESFRLNLRQFFHYSIWSFQLVLAIIFYFLSIQCAGHAIPGMVIGLQPLFVALFAFVLFRERISTGTWLSCLVAFTGIVILSGSQSGAVLNSRGLIYALISALLLGINFTYHLRYLQNESVYRLVFFQSVLQLPLLGTVLMFVPFHFVVADLFPFALLGIICTGAAYLLIYAGSKKVKKELIGILQSVENIIPVLTGVLFAHEHIAWAGYSGLSLILIAGLWNLAKDLISPAQFFRFSMARKLKHERTRARSSASID